MKRRTVLAGLSSSAAAISLPALAQGFDASRTIRIVVPVPAGGPIDVQARALALELAKTLKANIVVDNKPGASTMLGSADVAKAAPDGRTLLYTADQTVTQVPHTMLKQLFDPLKDLTPVMRTATISHVLVTHPSVPGKTVRELVDYARQNPGKVSYATFGPGTPPHLFGAQLAQMEGLDLIAVPYKGVADTLSDLLSGRVQFTFTVPSVAMQYLPDGKLKALALMGTRRNAYLPDVPTMAELGYKGFEGTAWLGMFGPPGMKPEVMTPLRSALAAALKQPGVLTTWKQLAFEFPPEESQAEATRVIAQEYDKWGKAIRALGIQPQ